MWAANFEKTENISEFVRVVWSLVGVLRLLRVVRVVCVKAKTIDQVCDRSELNREL